MRAGRDVEGDPLEMQVHGLGLAFGQDDPGARAFSWADRTKDPGRSTPLILGR
jgi:hypothetical protein